MHIKYTYLGYSIIYNVMTKLGLIGIFASLSIYNFFVLGTFELYKLHSQL